MNVSDDMIFNFVILRISECYGSVCMIVRQSPGWVEGDISWRYGAGASASEMYGVESFTDIAFITKTN